MSKYQTLYRYLTLRRAKKKYNRTYQTLSDLIDQKTYSKDSLHTCCTVFIDCTLDDSVSDVHPSNKFYGVLSYMVNDLHLPEHENINGWTLRLIVLYHEKQKDHMDRHMDRKKLRSLSELGD